MATSTDPKNGAPKRASSAGGSAAVGDDDDVAFAVMAGIAVLAAVILLLTGLLNTGGSSTGSGASSSAGDVVAAVAAAVSVDVSNDGVTLSGVVPDEATAEKLRAAAAATYGADHVTDHLTITEGATPLTVSLNGDLADEASLDSLAHSFEGLGLGEGLDNHLTLSASDDGDAAAQDAEEGAAGEGAAEDGSATEEEVVEEAVEEEPAVVAAVAILTATDDGITLDGTVPSEAAAEELRAAAATSYGADQIVDNLVVVEGADPFTVEASGELGSAETLEALTGALEGLGLGEGVSSGLALSEGGSIVAALNDLVGLDPILFETSSATIAAQSQATLDEAARILIEFPDAAIEIGGHTDSRGGADANKALSDARAQSVKAALVERGVTNELTAIGFGEEQLKEDPDDTVEQQQLNRRIEFKVL